MLNHVSSRLYCHGVHHYCELALTSLRHRLSRIPETLEPLGSPLANVPNLLCPNSYQYQENARHWQVWRAWAIHEVLAVKGFGRTGRN